MENIENALCYYDPRNPAGIGGGKPENCVCDNCFYGRTELAEEILKQQKNMKTIDIQGKEWRDKVNGNSYCSVRVTIDYGMKTQKELRVPFTYGYGEYYRQAAFELLRERGILKGKLSDKVIVRSNIQRNCLKRDVIAWGN